MADVDGSVVERLARLERQVAALQRDLATLTALAARSSIFADAAPAATEAPPAPAPAGTPLERAWRALERDDASHALDEALLAFRLAREANDAAALTELAAFAAVAVSVTEGVLHERAERLRVRAAEARAAPETRAAPATTADAPPPAAASRPAPQPAPVIPPPAVPQPPRPGYGERAVGWLRAELTGARTFALLGGLVMLLGVIFLFVLAANRGVIGPTERVALGAAVSIALLGVGIVLRIRYDRFQAALAAVGAGIAASYTTLAAATMLYSYLPSWGALLVAAGIAAVGSAVAVAWSSQIVAGLALGGAAAAPGLVALDDGITWPGPAFALVVLAATIAVASPRRWLWLDDLVVAVAVAQLVWLAFDAPIDDSGAVIVTCVGSLVVLAGAIAWQAYGRPGLDGAAATFALLAGLVALWSPMALLSERRDTGLVLLGLAAAFAVVALAIARRLRDLAWTVGAEALMLVGVASAFLVSGRSLTVVWAIEATTLAALAWKLRTPRFEAGALVYLAASAVNAFVIEIAPDWPEDAFDVPRGAATGLFVLAGASLATGLLLPAVRADRPSEGMLAALEPVWDELVRARIALRALLATFAAVSFGAASAAVISGRWLTIAWAVVAAVLGAGAFVLGERRLQPVAYGFLAASSTHAVAAEVPLDTLMLDRLADPLAPVASLVAVAAAGAVLAALARFETRGIAWLGPLAGPERALEWLRVRQERVRATLAFVAAVAGVWAAGLAAIELSYEWGQVVATGLWGLLGTVVVAVSARARATWWQLIGGAIVVLAFLKSGAFDWDELGDGAATVSALLAASLLLLAGFLARWENPPGVAWVEVPALVAAAAAAVVAIVALERWLDIDSRSLGVATLVVAGVLIAAGLPPYLRWRAGREEPWLRRLANGYWAIALFVLLFAENTLVRHGAGGTIAAWAGTAAVLALAWKPLAEERVWIAALGLTAIVAFASLATVTLPSKLVESSDHPARGLWALAVVVLAAWTAALTTPPMARALKQWVLGAAAALTLYGFSLGVLELVERVSSASVKTDFQRGHTALSALWGIGALALYVVGLARERRDLRIVGLTLFGLALAKLFLYDLSRLSSITRAFSFLAVGAILLTAGFFAERLVRLRSDGPADTPAT